jgi:FMN phosphatase YigB (HAD superfamily)
MVEEFTIQMRQTYIPIPGALKTIRTLREEGVNVAILTNGDNRESVQQQLSRWRFPDLADSLYSHHVTGFKKPDPQAVECILDDYSRAGQDFPKDRIVLVGDYAQDVETAHNLGTDSVLVMRGPGWEKIKIRDPRPTYVVSEVSALLAVINGTLPPLSSSEVYVPPVFWKGEDWCPVAKKTN